MLLLWILVLVVGIAWLAHRRTAPLPALGIIAVYLLAMGIFRHASHAPVWLLLIFWVLLAAVAAPCCCRTCAENCSRRPYSTGFKKPAAHVANRA